MMIDFLAGAIFGSTINSGGGGGPATTGPLSPKKIKEKRKAKPINPYFDEIYGVFFYCPNCNEDNIYEEHLFCPNCGATLDTDEMKKLAKEYSKREGYYT